MSSVRSMTEGNPLRLIVSVALPLMVGNIFQQLYTVVDAQVVGSVEGVSALAALGASEWFSWLFLGVIQGLAQGFAIPMAQAFGAKDHAALRRSIGNAIFLAAVCAALITGTALLLIEPVLTLMDTPTDILPTSISYLRIIFAAFPIVMAYNLMAAILRSLGDGRSPLYAMVVACAVNISLDLLFVRSFGWGVEGAAIATAIAQGCSCLFCLYRLNRVPFIRLTKNDFRPHSRLCLQLILLSFPIAAQNAIIGIGGMVLQSIVNDMGVTFIAGFTATNKLYGVLEIAALSYGYAMSSFAGQNLGAHKPRRIRTGLHAAAITGVITSLVITAAMFLFGRAIVGSFISGTPEEVLTATDIAVEYLRLMSAFLPILYILHIYRSALQGMGNTLMPMLSGILELVMRVGAAMLLPSLIGYSGLFWAEVLAWLGADLVLVPACYISLRRFLRQVDTIT